MYEMYSLDELKIVLRLRRSEDLPDWIAREHERIEAVRQAAERFEAVERYNEENHDALGRLRRVAR